uniref:Protein kinase domain-containing protein n=1 Tax=Romanomermis culicivorax TaxID=13658 RepID=A0A915JC39_ROMCU
MIQAFDKEFQSLVKLDHPNLVSYISLFVRQNQESCSFYIIKSAQINVLPLNVIYERHIAVCMAYVKRSSRDILSALEYLHSKGVLHKEIDLDCIFDCGAKFLLSDFSVRKRMKGLCHFFKNDCKFGADYDEKVSSSRNFYGMGKISQKLDVFLLGVSLTALASGQSIEDNDVFKIPNTLPSSFKNFIRKMVAFNEENRWTASQLLKHSFLRNQAELDADYMRPDQIENIENEEGELQTMETNAFLSLPLNLQSNRLENEFDILKFLGRGGFGDVVKVRNKLDNGIYAIKRIVLQPNNKTEIRKITREVKLLSRLNHENVVRYYNSWIERASTKASNYVTSQKKSSSADKQNKKVK